MAGKSLELPGHITRFVPRRNQARRGKGHRLVALPSGLQKQPFAPRQIHRTAQSPGRQLSQGLGLMGAGQNGTVIAGRSIRITRHHRHQRPHRQQGLPHQIIPFTADQGLGVGRAKCHGALGGGQGIAPGLA